MILQARMVILCREGHMQRWDLCKQSHQCISIQTVATNKQPTGVFIFSQSGILYVLYTLCI